MQFTQEQFDRISQSLEVAIALADDPQSHEHIKVLAKAVKSLWELIGEVDDNIGWHEDLSH